MSDTIFTQIVKGDIPSHKIYEDSKNLCLSRYSPKNSGHVLVIAKDPVDHIWDLSDESYQALMQTVKRVGQRLRHYFPDGRIGIQVEGLEVPHAHVHVFPFKTAEDFTKRPDKDAEPDHQALAKLAQTLAF